MKLKPKNTAINQKALVYKRYNQLVDSTKLDVVYRTPADFETPNVPVRYWVFDSSIMDFREIPESALLPTTRIVYIYTLAYTTPYQFGNYFYAYILNEWKRFTATTNTSFSFTNELVTSNKRYSASPLYIGLKAGNGTLTIKNNSNVPIRAIEILLYNPQTSVMSTTLVLQTNEEPLAVGEEREFTFILAQDSIAIFIDFRINKGTETALSYDVTFGDLETFKFTDYLVTRFPQLSNIAKYQKNAYYYAGSFAFMIRGSISGSTSQYIKGNIVPLTSMNIKYFSDDIKLDVDDLVVVDGRLYGVENPETSIKYQPKTYNIYFVTLNNIL